MWDGHRQPRTHGGMSKDHRNRVRKGVAEGGQYSAENKAEDASIALGPGLPSNSDNPISVALKDHLAAPTPVTYAALRRTVPNLSRDTIDFALEMDASEESDPEELAIYLAAMSKGFPTDIGPAAFEDPPVSRNSPASERVGPVVRKWPADMKMSQPESGRLESRLEAITESGMAAFAEMDPSNGRVSAARIKDASKRQSASMQDFARELPHLTVNEALDHYEAASLACLDSKDWRGHLTAAADDERHYSGQEPALNGYQPPTTRTQDGYAPGGTTIGSKYTGFRPAKEVALDVFTDLAEARAAGYLPAAATFKVNHSTKRGIQEVSVAIGGLERSSVFGYPGSSFRVLSDAGMELERRVDLITDAYNKVERDGADMDRGMYQTHTGFDLS